MEYASEILLIYLYDEAGIMMEEWMGVRTDRVLEIMGPMSDQNFTLSFKMDEDVPSMISQRHDRIRNMFLDCLRDEGIEVLNSSKSIEILSYNFIGGTHIPNA